MGITQKSALRTVLIFVFAMAVSGILAVYVRLDPQSSPELKEFAQLIWLVGPGIGALIALTFGRQWSRVGLNPRFLTSWRDYVFSLGVPVLVSFALLAVSALLNPAAFEHAIPLTAPLIGLVASVLIKNLFEEFYWRGVVGPALLDSGAHPLVAHGLTGLIWSSWHLPYWFLFLSAAEIEQVSGLNVPQFVLLAYVALTMQSYLYGEIRVRSGSMWPAYILHTMSNLVSLSLPLLAYTNTHTPLNLVLTPDTHGLGYSLLFALAGWMMWSKRAAQI